MIYLLIIFAILHAAFGLALGFFVLKYSISEVKWLKITGMVIGWLIIAVSVLFSIAAVTKSYDIEEKASYCPFMEMKKEYLKQHKSFSDNEKDLDDDEEITVTGKSCRID